MNKKTTFNQVLDLCIQIVEETKILFQKVCLSLGLKKD